MAIHLLDGATRVRPRRNQHRLVALARHLDLALIGSALLLALVGVVIVYSATRNIFPAEPSYFMKRQIIYVTMGIVVMLLCAFLDYRRLDQWAYLLYGLAVVSLLAVLVIGKSQQGAQRWISFGPVTFQPSEFGVLAIVIACGVYASHHESELHGRHLLALIGIALLPMILTYRQPDRSTTIVMAITFFTVLVFAGVRLRYLLGGLALAAFVIFIAVEAGLVPLGRLTAFLHQSAQSQSSNYDVTYTKEAIGAGGRWGTGLFKGQVTNLGYVPINYADFIFSAVGEQLGFVGCAAVLGLFGTLAFRIFRAAQRARDVVARTICGGVLAFLVFSVFQNIGMNIGIVPITGIPLPFISFGGSALLAFFAAVGLVANVEMRRHLVR